LLFGSTGYPALSQLRYGFEFLCPTAYDARGGVKMVERLGKVEAARP
jgi:hypothetical protein